MHYDMILNQAYVVCSSTAVCLLVTLDHKPEKQVSLLQLWPFQAI